MLKLNEINVNELINNNDCLYSNRNDIELNIDSSGYSAYIEMIYEDDSMNVEIVRRKDDNRIFKLCYDNGDSLCEVYKLVNEVYVDSDNEEVYG